MRKLKAFLAGLTALSCCCASCLPVAEQIPAMYSVIANAEEEEDTEEIATSGTCGENLTWNFDESTGTLTINGTGEMDNWSYTEPDWWYFGQDIEKIILENGVTSIGDGAFSSCKSLTSVIIPDSVTSVGMYAFDGTAWLENKRTENPLVIVNGILIDGTTCEQEETAFG